MAILIASFGAYVSWKSHKRTLMLGMPAVSPFLGVAKDDQEALSISVTNDGPRVNRIITFGLLFEDGMYAPLDPKLIDGDPALAPGERIEVPINVATYKRRWEQSGKKEIVGVFVKDLDLQVYAEAIRIDLFSDPILTKPQIWKWRLVKLIYRWQTVFKRKAKEFVFLRGCLADAEPSIFKLRRPRDKSMNV